MLLLNSYPNNKVDCNRVRFHSQLDFILFKNKSKKKFKLKNIILK